MHAKDVMPELPVERDDAVGDAVKTPHAGGESVSTSAGRAQEELASTSITHPLHLHLQKNIKTEDPSWDAGKESPHVELQGE